MGGLPDLLNKVGGEADYGIILRAFDNAVARSSCRDLTDFINQCANPDSNIGAYFGDDNLDTYFKLLADPLRRQSVLDIASLSGLKEDFAREISVILSYTSQPTRSR